MTPLRVDSWIYGTINNVLENNPSLSSTNSFPRLAKFFNHNFDEIILLLNKIPKYPKINVRVNKSVDVHWETGNSELLINIPDEAYRPIEFHGSANSGATTLSGTIAGNEDSGWLLFWLINNDVIY